MRTINNKVHEDGQTVTSIIERGIDKDMLGFSTDGMYKVGPYILSGHDIGVMDRVFWDAEAQEWKKAKP